MKPTFSKPLESQQTDLDRAARRIDQFERRTTLLAQITSSSVLDAANYRWTYSWQEAILTASSSQAKATGLTGTAISLSELSNAVSGRYSYGVNPANLTGTGFVPVAIPNNTLVLITPLRQLSGVLRWVIINTQAIDGVCI